MKTVVIKFSDMPNYICNYDIINAKAKGYKRKQQENRDILLDAGVSVKAADDICLLTHIRHVYHTENEILFMNKEHIKLLKKFLKELNNSVASIKPKINPLVIDKDGYNNLTSENITEFNECMEKFNDSIKLWLSKEIDEKLNTFFVELGVERPKDEKREQMFSIKNEDRLSFIKKKNTIAPSDVLTGQFVDYRFILDRFSDEFQEIANMFMDRDIVEKVISFYEKNMPDIDIPSDLSYFDSDYMWESAKSNPDINDEEAKKRYLLVKFYTSLEITNIINPQLTDIPTRLFKIKRKAGMKKGLKNMPLFPFLTYVIYFTDCDIEDDYAGATLKYINRSIINYMFNINSIPGMNHGLLYRLFDDETAQYWYVANLAGALKISVKYLLYCFLDIRWNGRGILGNKEAVKDMRSFIHSHGKLIAAKIDNAQELQDRIYAETDPRRRQAMYDEWHAALPECQ